MGLLAPEIESLAHQESIRFTGTVSAIRGLTVLVRDLPVPLGSQVSVRGRGEWTPSHRGSDGLTHSLRLGEVVGFTRDHAVVMLLGQTTGIRVGDFVVGESSSQSVAVGPRLLGRVIDGLGRPIDNLGAVGETTPRPVCPAPVRALERRRITKPMHTGVRAIDLMTTLGRGQRIGIFAGPGVGKSTLLGQIVRGTSADVCVVALVGERGREVGDFLHHGLGTAGMAKSVLVVATSDESPLLRVRAALTACAVAEHFRDAGKDVLLVMDSVTRFAHAQRQIGLAMGEPPATRGYTPSVFASLALLLERAGAVGSRRDASEGPRRPGEDRRSGGSITGLYTVLVEGDDATEPVSDAVRGILDGHIMLSRRLGQRGHFPAIDVLDSVSRVGDAVCDAAHWAARSQVLRLLAAYASVEELVQIGAYVRGSNPEADVAIQLMPRIEALLRQGRDEPEDFEKARSALISLALDAGDALAKARPAERR